MAYPVPFYPSKVTQLIDRMTALATNQDFAPFCKKFDCTPAQAHEGGPLTFLQIGTGTGGGRVRILIVSGVHARELAQPDALMTFVEKLLAAYKATAAMVYDRFDDARPPPTGPTRYERFTIAYPIVQRIVERAELYVLPVANPDGRAFVQTNILDPHKSQWRKNRAPAPPGARTCLHAGDDVGVDINRNFDVGWEFGTYYSAAALTSMANTAVSGERLGVSDLPCDFQTFHGSGTAATRTREPETTAIVNLLNAKNINFYMDLHSAAGQILFPWGLEQNQEDHPEQTFKNTSKDHQRDGKGTTYKEWMPPGTEARHLAIATFMNNAILDSTGFTALAAANDPNTGLPRDATAERARRLSNFPPMQSPFSFGVFLDWEPGGSDDFAFSRQIGGAIGPGTVATALDPVVSLTFESGHDDDGGFQPKKNTEYPKVEREIGAGIAAFLANAAGWHSTIVTSGPPPPPASKSWCFIATAAYGSPLHPKVRYLCDVRDNEVKTTRFGKRFMDRWDRVYYSFSPQVADWLRRHERARTAVRLFGAEPWIAMVRVVRALTRRIGNAELRAASFLGLVSLGTLGAIGAVVFLLVLLGRFVAGLA